MGKTETAAKLPYEDHAKALGTALWLCRAAAAYAAWPLGKEVTLEEFNAAVDAAANSRIG